MFWNSFKDVNYEPIRQENQNSRRTQWDWWWPSLLHGLCLAKFAQISCQNSAEVRTTQRAQLLVSTWVVGACNAQSSLSSLGHVDPLLLLCSSGQALWFTLEKSCNPLVRTSPSPLIKFVNSRGSGLPGGCPSPHLSWALALILSQETCLSSPQSDSGWLHAGFLFHVFSSNTFF